MNTVTVPEAIVDRIRSGQRFLITSHLNPDGDAVGTAVGLARLLRRTGKSTQVWLHDQVPDLYLPIDERQARWLAAVDGRRTLGEILGDEAAGESGGTFFQRLWDYDQIVFDTSRG